MEKVILVDENDKQIGVAEKMEAHRKGLLHRAFSVCIFNEKGEMLIQKRNPKKYHSGGLWSNACCGHPRPGEEIIDAAERRLEEEMGIKVNLKEWFSFIYKNEFRSGLTENEFDHVLREVADEILINPNKDEVSDWKWININDLKADINKYPEAYTYWFKLIIDKRQLT